MASYEISFTYREPILQATAIRLVDTSALPSLPLAVPRPDDALELVRPATALDPELVLYRRPYARLGHAEAYGPDSEWSALPRAHAQVLVSLVPDLEPPLEAVVYASGVERLRIPLPLPQQPPPLPPAPPGAGTVEGLVLLHGNAQDYRRRFNLVLVAEGYRIADRGRFEDDVAAVVRAIRMAPPFDGRAGAFNVFRLDVWSMEAGADRGNTAPVNTYFNAVFPGTFAGSAAPPQLLLVDDELVLATVARQMKLNELASLPHKIIVLVNTEHHGGSGGAGDGIAVASRSLGTDTMARTVLHELGHTFGLVDEYPAGGGWGPNLALGYDLASLPWRDVLLAASPPLPPLPTFGRGDGSDGISLATVGAFVDPALPGWYRSQWLCRMRYSRHEAFCKVCARYIDRALEMIS